ncbi:MAG: A/G-specific adenine glycosylase [Candidatus Lindowbacteria bacterium RIFCSPLOWO2_12_FULL_62_27]|nr:MAG: A/G-specific adenine glycosylase [Candidatus Lindowbacteria bacterium RIFCSPLOWO2_12_FULL_62_27]OGH63716.1 MAG: A/G-specific adenine glycosylase [Candidatus Lindowbacteria bacterium RIFCSPLOWO2_02_FULL_62_12]
MLRIPAFRRALLGWYRRHRRDLPWRRTRDPYRILVSEIMLQQTQAVTVVPYYERFLKAFPTVQALARARREKLMKLWEGLGYYARARNLHEAARRIVRDCGGRVPRDPEVFSNLPGAGPYTTAAVLSIAYGAPLAAVDGNVRRVIARLYDIGRPLASDDREVRERADRLLEDRHAGDFNQAMMELGARICVPTNPACLLCPVRPHCAAFAGGTVGRRPVTQARRARPHKRVVAAVIRKNGKILIGLRPWDQGLLGGLWEFPGGKIEPGESPETAVRREMQEEIGADVEAGPAVSTVDHVYTHLSITLSGHFCRLKRGTPKPLFHAKLRWVRPCDLARYAFPEANRKLIREMRERKLL